MTVIVSSTAFWMDTSCSLLKNVSSAQKMEAEVSSRIFVQAVCGTSLYLGSSTGSTERGVRLVTNSRTVWHTLHCLLFTDQKYQKYYSS